MITTTHQELKSQALDPMTLISIGMAAAPLIEKYIGILSKNLRCAAFIDIGGVKYGYTEHYNTTILGWEVGYYNPQKGWATVTESSYPKIREARKAFRQGLHN